MKYPISMQFKISAVPQITMTDADGQVVGFVRQKFFKLKENVKIFSDVEQTNQVYEIAADRVLDYSAQYRFTDMTGAELGSVKRQGRKSLWKARYDIYDGDEVIATINEENAWMKVGDALFSGLPLVGMLSGYVFQPTYLVTRTDGTDILRITKEKSLIGRQFMIHELVDIPEASEVRTLLAILMMTLRERGRS